MDPWLLIQAPDFFINPDWTRIHLLSLLIATKSLEGPWRYGPLKMVNFCTLGTPPLNPHLRYYIKVRAVHFT